MRAGGTLLFVFQEISFIYRHSILLQECTVFLGEGDPFVVLFLSHDVSNYHVFVAHTIAETCILSSPAAEVGKVRVALQPLAGVCLHPLNEV